MRHLDPLRSGTIVGLVAAIIHVFWAALVAAGLAGPLLAFIMRLHFIDMPFAVRPFALGTAALLVGLTFVIGAGVGAIFAWLWNRLAAEGDAVVANVTAPLPDSMRS